MISHFCSSTSSTLSHDSTYFPVILPFKQLEGISYIFRQFFPWLSLESSMKTVLQRAARQPGGSRRQLGCCDPNRLDDEAMIKPRGLTTRDTGWWLSHPAEEYESQLGWWNSKKKSNIWIMFHIPNTSIWKNVKSKTWPPTRIIWMGSWGLRRQ